MGREGGRFRLGRLLAPALALLLAISLIWPAPAGALGFPGRQQVDAAARAAGPGRPRQGAFQEVAPPPAVQELRQAQDHLGALQDLVVLRRTLERPPVCLRWERLPALVALLQHQERGHWSRWQQLAVRLSDATGRSRLQHLLLEA